MSTNAVLALLNPRSNGVTFSFLLFYFSINAGDGQQGGGGGGQEEDEQPPLVLRTPSRPTLELQVGWLRRQLLSSQQLPAMLQRLLH
jgi:hypothetical protein